MRTAAFCYAEGDSTQAQELAEFLEAGCPFHFDLSQGRTGPDFDLIDAAAQAISADVALVLLSPHSAPQNWARERWEPVFLEEASAMGTRVAFLLLGDCKFPALFRRRDFFDFSKDRDSARRRLKRWLLGGNLFCQGIPENGGLKIAAPELAALENRLADRPGIVSGVMSEAALQFASAFADDFEGILRLDCHSRTRAGILGDLAEGLGLRLTGRVDKNRSALRQFCREYRLLLLFEHLGTDDHEFVSLGGLTSIIFMEDTGKPGPEAGFADLLDLFSGWVHHEDACLAALGDAQRWLKSDAGVDDRLQLAWAATVFLRHRERLAEAYEILDWMKGWLHERGDTLELHRVLWEQSWILDHWGETAVVHPPEPPVSNAEQLAFAW